MEGVLTLPGLDDWALDAAEVSSDVADEVVFLRVIHDLLPECTGLLKVNCTRYQLELLLNVTMLKRHSRSVMKLRSTLA